MGEVVLAPVLRAVRVGLGHAVADAGARLREARRHPAHELGRRRCAAAADAAQARRVVRPRSAGDASRSQLWVGTPTKFVTRSRSMSSSARSGSHLYMITSFSPLDRHDSITGTHPVTWKSGTTRMNVSGSVLGAVSGFAQPVGGRAAAEPHERLHHGAVGRHGALRMAGRPRRVEDGGVVVGVDVDVGHGRTRR